jgi:hypothetical protein
VICLPNLIVYVMVWFIFHSNFAYMSQIAENECLDSTHMIQVSWTVFNVECWKWSSDTVNLEAASWYNSVKMEGRVCPWWSSEMKAVLHGTWCGALAPLIGPGDTWDQTRT